MAEEKEMVRGYGNGEGNGNCYGNGYGEGNGCGYGDGSGNGNGNGKGDGYGSGYGNGNGYGYGNGEAYGVELTKDGRIRVGCHCKTIGEWEITWKEEAKAHEVSREKASEMMDLARFYMKADKERNRT